VSETAVSLRAEALAEDRKAPAGLVRMMSPLHTGSTAKDPKRTKGNNEAHFFCNLRGYRFLQ
jgi:hypothetical protein